jgi:hypothetical protein
MTWAPGDEMLIKSRLIADGGWFKREGVTCFNSYRPPVMEPGNAAKAGPWVEHTLKMFPDGFWKVAGVRQVGLRVLPARRGLAPADPAIVSEAL